MFKLIRHNQPSLTFPTQEAFEAGALELGHEVTGAHRHRGLAGSAIPEGVPKFRTLNGPMRDGAAIRYETPRAYRALSS